MLMSILSKSGYLARKVQNFVTCASCIQFLVPSHTSDYCHTKMPLVRVEEAKNLPEAFRRMIDLQDLGGLHYPSNECIRMVMIAAEFFRELSMDDKRRPEFLASHSSQEVFVKIYTEVISNEFCASLSVCQSGCSMVNTVVPDIPRSLFHVQGNNMVSMTNSDDNSRGEKNRDLDAHKGKTKNQTSFKKQKLLLRKCNKCIFLCYWMKGYVNKFSKKWKLIYYICMIISIFRAFRN